MKSYERTREQELLIVFRRLRGDAVKDIAQDLNVAQSTLESWFRSDWYKDTKQQMLDTIAMACGIHNLLLDLRVA